MADVQSSFAASTEDYPLRHSVILDPATTISITNAESRLVNYRQAPDHDFVWSGDRKLPIHGYGTMTVQLGSRVLLLNDVAYCPRLLTTLVSLRQLRGRGYYWDNKNDPTTLRRKDGSLISTLQDRCGQYVLEYRPHELPLASFATYRKKYTTWTKRPPLTGEAIRWHHRMGHPGPAALEHLVHSSQGVKIRGPTTVECEACALAKITRQPRRMPRVINEDHGERLAIDFHNYIKGIDDYTSQMLITCRQTGYTWDYYFTERTAIALINTFRSFLGMMETQYHIKVKVIECDNEITEVKQVVGRYLENKHIKLEPSAPYTQAQNGAAERSGGVIKEKERAMRTGARLPHQLWPEIGKTAVYLYNRTPNYGSRWRTPYTRFYEAVARARGVPNPSYKPDQTHLRSFGCKAYAMTPTAQQKFNRLQRLAPKAWVGYLIGYRASNIYRIWIPSQNKMINTRDVIMNEEELCDGKWDTFKDELLSADTQLIADFVTNQSVSDDDILPEPESEDTAAEDILLGEDQDESGIQESEEATPSGRDEPYPFTTAKFALWTPPQTPPSALLTHGMAAITIKDTALSEEGPKVVPWQAAFLAGHKAVPRTGQGNDQDDRAKLERSLRQGVKIHRAEIPAPPRWHHELHHHPFGKLFLQAEADHLQSHKDMQSWTEISRKDPRTEGKQILDCMWVYVYKFDKHGRFQKCKARLVVRGDQQAKSQNQETYAATLAGRSFRTLIAIAARFDLELIQYDVVNAFVHAPIDQDIFMRMPDGYRKKNTILLLNKALYGLRISPLLWQREFMKTLAEIGYTQVPHEPCAFIKKGILVFFYVDDVIIAHRNKDAAAVDQLTQHLKKKYKISGGEPIQWFLGMEVIRNRLSRTIWLSQKAYFEKIAKLAENKKVYSTPMGSEELLPRSTMALPHEIQKYQKKIGSLLFAAVSTRPDIAFATARLARFLNNPSQAHQDAADRALIYLINTKELSLKIGGSSDLVVASDASFADNSIDRKSTQAFAMKLFGGLISWRSNKQDTVTTSTTEAELLALAQAAKETLFVSRLLNELSIQLDNNTITIECDNKQTINLINAEIALLKTKLRHVDIHNHWLRQEVQQERIKVIYKASNEMIADGLTKSLPTGKWQNFLQQMGLEIAHRDQNR